MKDNNLATSGIGASKPWYWHLILSSIILAGIVGLTEALVAVYFVGTFSFAVLLPALIISFILYRADIFDLLNAISNRLLFKDKDGSYFTGIKAYILKLALGLALFSGASCAFLQLNSILVTFGHLFWGLSAGAALAAPPMGLIALAAFLVTISTIANCALLYANVEKFVREDYKPYWRTIKIILGLNKDKKPMLWRIYHGVFAALGLTCAVTIYMITFGLFKQQAYKVFNSFWKLSASSSLLWTKIIVYPGQILNGFFYGRNIVNFARNIEDFIKALLNKILPASYQDRKSQSNSDSVAVPADHALLKSLFLVSSSALAYTIIFGCAAVNGHAQGQGAVNEQAAWNWMTKIVSDKTAKNVAYVIMTLGSLTSNFFASFEEKWLQPSAASLAHVKNRFKFGSESSHVVASVVNGSENNASAAHTSVATGYHAVSSTTDASRSINVSSPTGVNNTTNCTTPLRRSRAASCPASRFPALANRTLGARAHSAK